MPPRLGYLLPDFIREALNEHRLMDADQARPAYQQNNYIGSVTRAKLETTRSDCVTAFTKVVTQSVGKLNYSSDLRG